MAWSSKKIRSMLRVATGVPRRPSAGVRPERTPTAAGSAGGRAGASRPVGAPDERLGRARSSSRARGGPLTGTLQQDVRVVDLRRSGTGPSPTGLAAEVRVGEIRHVARSPGGAPAGSAAPPGAGSRRAASASVKRTTSALERRDHDALPRRAERARVVGVLGERRSVKTTSAAVTGWPSSQRASLPDGEGVRQAVGRDGPRGARSGRRCRRGRPGRGRGTAARRGPGRPGSAPSAG